MHQNHLNISLLINSFTGNITESSQSEEILSILKSKHIPLTTILDINQDKTFEKDKKLHKNIRDQYHHSGKLFKISNHYPIPQLSINNSLLLTYSTFKSLNDSGLLDKIIKGEICHHLRFFNGKIIQSQQDDTICIYCYSEKKRSPIITAVLDLHNSSSEENNDVLSFCENNGLTISLYDYENPFLYKNIDNKKVIEAIKDQRKIVMIDNEIESFGNFYALLDKKCSLDAKTGNKCCECGKVIECSVNLKKCFDCLMGMGRQKNSVANSLTEFPEKTEAYYGNNNHKKRNPYNFIEKLRLKRLDIDEMNGYEYDKENCEEEIVQVGMSDKKISIQESVDIFRTYQELTMKKNELSLDLSFS